LTEEHWPGMPPPKYLPKSPPPLHDGGAHLSVNFLLSQVTRFRVIYWLVLIFAERAHAL
jgi:hypothetical protein